MKTVSLSELNREIRNTIKNRFVESVWVRAEISELNHKGGHAYMEFVEKSEKDDSIVAKARGTCWASTFQMLKPYFEEKTGETLRAGLKVLVAVTVEFSDVYGFSLNVKDIDPIYSVGELAAKRLEIIKRLQEDGIMDLNKEIEMPTIPTRVAVISSPTAAGYGDFCHQLQNNPYNFHFYVKLFPAIMQGEKAEQSIIDSLDRIYKYYELFDVVLIIRGGGATTDLACFDSYPLALNCAQFPLPIISGVGHHRDVSVLDMVTHKAVKTPTAAAEFLIDIMCKNMESVMQLSERLLRTVHYRVSKEQNNLLQLSHRLKSAIKKEELNMKYRLEMLKNRVINSTKHRLALEKNSISILETKIESSSPKKLMEKGYSFATIDGKVVKSVKSVKSGEVMKTYLADGTFESVVK